MDTSENENERANASLAESVDSSVSAPDDIVEGVDRDGQQIESSELKAEEEKNDAIDSTSEQTEVAREGDYLGPDSQTENTGEILSDKLSPTEGVDSTSGEPSGTNDIDPDNDRDLDSNTDNVISDLCQVSDVEHLNTSKHSVDSSECGISSTGDTVSHDAQKHVESDAENDELDLTSNDVQSSEQDTTAQDSSMVQKVRKYFIKHTLCHF